MRSKERLRLLLLNMKDRLATPGDVALTSGLPRYEVLASFHVLEALRIIEPVHVRGNFKIYRLTKVGEELLKALENGGEFEVNIVYKPSSESEMSSLGLSKNSSFGGT
ncbi:MAG: hypothetical protein DRO18_07635 [Thermoprotei archaeon]|nr:MAG: hypothetical protein DRO18_07635 [Thermoprotei archaeon]